ncbi:MAG: tetratricopeptide repeat protein [Candidatus Obscuribacterales bacterium]|nr:tetratricopeptide repeat protein [Candidatus Obscuribacterales bacterium]
MDKPVDKLGQLQYKRFFSHFWVCIYVVLAGVIFSPMVQGAQTVDEEGMKCVHQAIQQKQLGSAFEQLCKMAEHDCGYSQCLLGIMYEKGLGVKKDIDRAIEKYREAAEPLYRRAMDILENDKVPRKKQLATTLQNLAVLCEMNDRIDEAENLFSRAISMLEESEKEWEQ